jgi:hypothetical protein
LGKVSLPAKNWLASKKASQLILRKKFGKPLIFPCSRISVRCCGLMFSGGKSASRISFILLKNRKRSNASQKHPETARILP